MEAIPILKIIERLEQTLRRMQDVKQEEFICSCFIRRTVKKRFLRPNLVTYKRCVAGFYPTWFPNVGIYDREMQGKSEVGVFAPHIRTIHNLVSVDEGLSEVTIKSHTSNFKFSHDDARIWTALSEWHGISIELISFLFCISSASAITKRHPELDNSHYLNENYNDIHYTCGSIRWVIWKWESVITIMKEGRHSDMMLSDTYTN